MTLSSDHCFKQQDNCYGYFNSFAHNISVSPLSCVSCVPASCVHIWFVSCPCFKSLWVKYVPAVCMWLCVNYPVYLVPVFWVWFRLVYSLLPGVSCLSALSCPTMSCLDVIKNYYLSLSPRLRVPVSSLVCAPWQKTRPNRKQRPFTSFCFRFWKFLFVPEFCLFVPRQGSRRSSSCPSLRHDGVGVRRDSRECRESTGREPSCPPIAGDIRRQRWLSQARRRVA